MYSWLFWDVSLLRENIEDDPKSGHKMKYRIHPIERTVRMQVVKFFCSRGFVKHSYNRTPNKCQSWCYKARGKVCDLVWVTSGGKFNMRRRSLVLAGPPKSAKTRRGGGGVRLLRTVCLIGRIRYLNIHHLLVLKLLLHILRNMIWTSSDFFFKPSFTPTCGSRHS